MGNIINKPKEIKQINTKTKKNKIRNVPKDKSKKQIKNIKRKRIYLNKNQINEVKKYLIHQDNLNDNIRNKELIKINKPNRSIIIKDEYQLLNWNEFKGNNMNIDQYSEEFGTDEESLEYGNEKCLKNIINAKRILLNRDMSICNRMENYLSLKEEFCRIFKNTYLY